MKHFAFVKGLKYHFYLLMALLHFLVEACVQKRYKKALGQINCCIAHHVTWSIEQKTKLTVSPHVRQSKTVLGTGFQAVDSGFRIPLVSGFPGVFDLNSEFQQSRGRGRERLKEKDLAGCFEQIHQACLLRG